MVFITTTVIQTVWENGFAMCIVYHIHCVDFQYYYDTDCVGKEKDLVYVPTSQFMYALPREFDYKIYIQITLC